MRRLYTALGLMAMVFLIAACSIVHGALTRVGLIDPNPIGYPIRYTARPDTTKVLTLQRDGTYSVLIKGDTFQIGQYALVNPDTVIIGGCALRVLGFWLHDATSCLLGPTWRQSPLNTRWPPKQSKPPSVSSLLPEPRYTLALLLNLPADSDN